MKKLISLIVAVAMLCTMVLLPTAAFADNLNLASTGSGQVAILYAASNASGAITEANPVHPGDTFTVEVKMNVNDAVGTDAEIINIQIAYDKMQFTYDSFTATLAGGSIVLDADGSLRYINESASGATLVSGDNVLGTLTFTVAEGALNATSDIGANTASGDTYLIMQDGSDYSAEDSNLTEAKSIVNIAQNEIEVLIDGKKVVENGSYHNPDGVTVSVSGERVDSATVKLKDAEGDGDSIKDAGKLLETAGIYVVTYKAYGWTAAKTVEFTLSLDEIKAALAADWSNVDAAGHKAAAEIEVPITISGLAGEEAAMVTFDVTDADGAFEISVKETEADGVKLVGNKVTYGTETAENGIAENGKVATLVLKVEADAAIGDHDIVLGNATVAFVTTTINPSDIDPAISFTNGTKTITVIADDIVTLDNTALKTDWTNQDYNIPITIQDGVTGVTVRVLAVNDGTTPDTATQENLAKIYTDAADNATQVAVNDEDASYYVVAKVGSSYQLIATLIPGATAAEGKIPTYLDKTAPTITVADGTAMTAWASSKEILDTAFTTNDDKSGEVTLKYTTYTGENLPEDATWTNLAAGGKIDFPASFNGNLVVRATDKAGNTKDTDPIAIMVDKDDPKVTATEGALDGDNHKPINIVVTDPGESIPVTAKVYFGNDEIDLTDMDAALTAIKGLATETNAAVDVTLTPDGETAGKYTGTHTAINPGWYYIIATDGANNEGAAKIQIELASIGAASAITVKTVKKADSYVSGFISDAEFDAQETAGTILKDKNNASIKTNGTFTYLAVEVADAVSGYANKMLLSKDGAEATEVSSVVLDAANTADIGNYKLTISTYNTTAPTVKAEATYTFSIQAPENMVSINGDNRYNAVEYARIKRFLRKNPTLTSPINGYEFFGGLFSGDMNGDLKLTADDYKQIIDSMRAGEVLGGYYTLDIMNQTKPEVTEPTEP